MMDIFTDTVIVGCGVGGLFTALNLPKSQNITIITKSDKESSDSFLAQGGMCVLRDESDYEAYFEDTMKAGHYENRKESVDIMIRSSQEILNDLINFGAEFAKKDGEICFTREGGHSRPRIVFHEDVTGREITSKLLAAAEKSDNISILEYTKMTDIIEKNGTCAGIFAENENGAFKIYAKNTVLACGGIGGNYAHSTNFPHLTGDGITIAQKHNIKTEHLDYVQIHPTTLYSNKPGRRFLISESVRGEGAVLRDKKGDRFTNELLPRDLLTAEIKKQMKKDGADFVMLDLSPIPKEKIISHFPHIYEKCLEEGYDIIRQSIPVVPAQHYFMGGIWVDSESKTSMDNLYAVGETSCNGVHGANRLASNSLLESLVFAKRAAYDIIRNI